MKTLRLSWQQMIASVAICGLSVAMATAQTPIAHWTFDEGINDYANLRTEDTQAAGGTSDPADDSDAVWGGTGGLTYGVGQIGGAAFLDGANDLNQHFDIPAIAALDGEFLGATFTGWFQPSTTGQTGQPYKGLLMTRDLEDSNGTGRNWGFAWEADGSNVDGRVSDSVADSDTTIVNDGSWYHVALVWDPDVSGGNLNPSKQLYVNGVATGSATPASGTTFVVDSGNWSIGRDPFNTTRHFRGGVDDFAIFGEVLSAGQILSLYNDGIGNGTSSTNANNVTVNDYLPGDVDGVGGVTATDYFTIRDNMNTDATGRDDGDLTGDGRVDLDDFAQWKSNAPGQVLLAAGFAVPEPGSLVLLSLAALVGLGSGRRSCVARTCG